MDLAYIIVEIVYNFFKRCDTEHEPWNHPLFWFTHSHSVGEDIILPHAIITDQRLDIALNNCLRAGG